MLYISNRKKKIDDEGKLLFSSSGIFHNSLCTLMASIDFSVKDSHAKDIEKKSQRNVIEYH